MFNIEVQALVTYTYTLLDEDELKVRKYAEQNEVSFTNAINYLEEKGEIYLDSKERTESDYETQYVKYSEFNNEKDTIYEK